MEKYKWLNKHSRLFLERGYLEEGVSPENRIRQIAETAEKYLGIEGFADKFEDYMSKGFYSLSTPVWTNFGTNRGLPVSCFNSHIPDTMQGILEKSSEVGMMSKFGGGTSGFFGELRPRGSKISVGGESGGPNQFFPFMDKAAELGIKEFLDDGGRIQQVLELFDLDADTVSQGSTRRGSFAAYLPIDHPDIEEFLLIRSEGHPIQNMSIGVCISDDWMESMLKGDRKKRELWLSVVKKRSETGYPYIFFTDTVNNLAPQCYKDNNIQINASNLCVAPETMLLTSDGYKPIFSLDGQIVEVWNGDCWSNALVSKTGENQKLIKVVTGDGRCLDCTEYHKFYTLFDGKRKDGQRIIVAYYVCAENGFYGFPIPLVGEYFQCFVFQYILRVIPIDEFQRQAGQKDDSRNQ
jgi:ribonucleoside-diphosphate reductase alpha chain